MQSIFVINAKDNVGVAIEDVESGETELSGAMNHEKLLLSEYIRIGHKAAVRDIVRGEYVIKYGVCIGKAIKDIKRGEWVHLHNMKSNYDERSSFIDPEEGIIKDTVYE